MFYSFDADRALPTGRAGFSADAKGVITARGEFFVYRSDGLSGHRTHKRILQDAGNTFEVGLVVAGTRLHQLTDGMAYVAGPGEAYVYDCHQPSRVAWTAHRGMHLRIRRHLVEAALGQCIPSVKVLTESLRSSRMWPFLRAQLTLLAERLTTLSDVERGLLLENTIDLCLHTLRTLHGDEAEAEDVGSSRHGLFVAAQRFIAGNLTDPELDTQTIARAIGCSRSTLYRVFAENELSVAAYIREQRLQRFLQLLQTADDRVSIAALAERSGFQDPVNVSKKFRQRFGVTPSDVRREAQLVREFKAPANQPGPR